MVVTRSSILSPKLPHGWRRILARSVDNREYVELLISPAGKKFESINDVSQYIKEEVECNATGLSKNISKREILDARKKEQEEMFDQRAIRIQKKKKAKSMKSPFRNLLKKVLKMSAARVQNANRRKRARNARMHRFR